MSKEKTLKDYLVEKKLKMADLSDITGVSLAQLHLIAKDPTYNVTAETIKKIMIGTQQRFKKPLYPWEYLHGWNMKL